MEQRIENWIAMIEGQEDPSLPSTTPPPQILPTLDQGQLTDLPEAGWPGE